MNESSYISIHLINFYRVLDDLLQSQSSDHSLMSFYILIISDLKRAFASCLKRLTLTVRHCCMSVLRANVASFH